MANEKKTIDEINANNLERSVDEVKKEKEDIIQSIEFSKIGSKTVVCCIVLKNGYEHVEYASAANPNFFDEENLKEIAKSKAMRTIYTLLEPYRLQSEKSDFYLRGYNLIHEDAEGNVIETNNSDIKSISFKPFIGKKGQLFITKMDGSTDYFLADSFIRLNKETYVERMNKKNNSDEDKISKSTKSTKSTGTKKASTTTKKATTTKTKKTKETSEE